MKTNQRIDLLLTLEAVIDDICQLKSYSTSKQIIEEGVYNAFLNGVQTVNIHNGWFTQDSVLSALKGIQGWLNLEKLNEWTSHYSTNESNPKTVGLIMAGNIPFVGFHDFLAVFLSGQSVQMKLSSDDGILWPLIYNVLNSVDVKFEDVCAIVQKLENFDAVIATGSDNSASYFHTYFGKYPHIIRKNRTSVAVLTGEESKTELELLGKDIFTYFGLGCRNVTQLLVPKKYDLTLFFESIYSFNDIINHHKYANNYDYNKAIYLLNSEDLLDNNFLLVRTSAELNSPIGVLFKYEYESEKELNAYLESNNDRIQAVVGHGYIPFGNSQSPGLMDYADGVDTMAFLTGLG